MRRELIDAGGHGLHAGVRYHHASAAADATTVFTAGACPLDGEGVVVR